MADPDPAAALDLRRLDAQVRGQLTWTRSTGSTNDLARAGGRTGEPDGSLWVTEEQTAGRGRRQREWHSPPRQGIYASLLVRGGLWIGTPAIAQLAAGVAVAEALQTRTRAEVELVWPNDCYAAGAKISGVLVESETAGGELEFLVVGIGINVNQPADAFPEELRGGATSLRRIEGRSFDRSELLVEVLRRFEELRGLAERSGAGAVLARWMAMAPSAKGAEVQVEAIEGILSGQTDGLAESGALRVTVDGETRELAVGELIRVRRRR